MFPYFLDFPLCSNSNVDEKIKEYILFCCDYLFERYPQKKLKAIVLTGSLSRGEGTILTCPNGSLRTFSDIETMVSFYDSEEKEARIHGRPVHLAGRIYKAFNENRL